MDKKINDCERYEMCELFEDGVTNSECNPRCYVEGVNHPFGAGAFVIPASPGIEAAKDQKRSKD